MERDRYNLSIDCAINMRVGWAPDRMVGPVSNHSQPWLHYWTVSHPLVLPRRYILHRYVCLLFTPSTGQDQLVWSVRPEFFANHVNLWLPKWCHWWALIGSGDLIMLLLSWYVCLGVVAVVECRPNVGTYGWHSYSKSTLSLD